MEKLKDGSVATCICLQYSPWVRKRKDESIFLGKACADKFVDLKSVPHLLISLSDSKLGRNWCRSKREIRSGKSLMDG